jgi:ABC-type transport system involved in multi-copper enzyme maturation permease subunit
MMWVALRVELAKAFSKWRTYIAFIAIGILIPIVVFSMKAEGEQYFSFATQAIQQVFTFSGNLMNGYTVAYILMGSLYVHMPFLVTLVAGDILAGEATGGTYRLLLTRPLSRTMMVSSKFITTVIATNALVLFMALLSIGLGVVTMGTGEVVVIQSKITILAAMALCARLWICSAGNDDSLEHRLPLFVARGECDRSDHDDHGPHHCLHHSLGHRPSVLRLDTSAALHDAYARMEVLL